MPKRSNDFQRLVFRLQSALHETDCKIEESALVYNQSSRNTEEIDVLVTFVKGGRPYRVAFHCRDHGRRGGPDWIRAIAEQRDDCRLDKVIAFHSTGFTAPAIETARDKNIEVYTTTEIDEVDFPAALNLPDWMMMVGVWARLTPTVVLDFEGDTPSLAAGDGLAALFFAAREVGPDEFRASAKALVQEWCHNQIYSGERLKCLPAEYRQQSYVDYVAVLQAGSYARFNSGARLPVISVSGTAVVDHELRYSRPRERLRVEGHAVLDGESALFGRGTRTLVATDGEATYAHVEPIPGTDLKVQSFTREHRPRVNPFASFEVRWRPESVVLSGPRLL